MADARKRARREASAAPGPPAAPAEPGAVEADNLVFPAEPSDETPQTSSAAVQLPASGLAEDILRQLEAEPTAVLAAGEQPPGRIELPASGLAEEILGRPVAAGASGDEEAPPAPPTELAAGPQPAVPGGHSLSFFAAPAQEQRAAAEATEHLVTFYLDREEYGVDVRQVQEIRRLTEITTVPRAPEFVRGVINLRGRILPVLDLKRKLGLGEVGESRAARIVVVRVRERLIGLLVDGASQVPKIPVSRIEAPPEEVVERGGAYIRGVAKLDDRLIILVDLERLLAHELKAQASPAAAPQAAVGHDGAS
ncbi:MAG: chemotaxis protein CheW [Betaproteobacteria bacterium]